MHTKGGFFCIAHFAPFVPLDPTNPVIAEADTIPAISFIPSRPQYHLVMSRNSLAGYIQAKYHQQGATQRR